MKKVKLAFGVLTGMLVTSPVLADIQILTGSSGVGNQDTHLTYTEPNSSNMLIPIGIPSHPAWAKPTSGAWIGPPNGHQAGLSGKYVYTYTFELPSAEDISISGKWSSDNGILIYLNSQLIVSSPGLLANTYGSLHSFSSSSHFKAGVNELRFEVDNGGGPTGLYVNANIKICQLYAVHDKKLNDSQLFTVSPTTFEVKALGDLKIAYDLEALDSHPQKGELFAASGENTDKPGYLYTVNKITGELTEMGPTGFEEIDGITFAPDGTLWAWATGDGLVTIDTQSAQATLIAASTAEVEDLTWNIAGTILYGVGNLVDGAPDVGTQLLAYDTTTGTLNVICQEQTRGQEIEALDTLPDDTLIFGVHGKRDLILGAIDPQTCQVIAAQKITTDYNDVEGVAWPNCQ